MEKDRLALALVLLFVGPSLRAGSDLAGEIRLTGEADSTPHYYRMTTEVVPIEPNGQRKAADVYDLWLEYAPRADGAGDLVTCRRYTVRQGEAPSVTLPSLGGWSYTFRDIPGGFHEQGRIFGIDQAKFENLAGANGQVLPMPVAYAVFNSFVDFHSMAQVFARRTREGNGIQDLKTIGQKILHASAYTQPPVSLGKMVEKGSFFRNGAVTLELKGLSLVGDRRSALIGYDSGDSVLEMTIAPMPQVTLKVQGGSHYTGDLYIDLETQWLLKATLMELVVTETSGAVLPQRLDSVVERRLLLRALSKPDFGASLVAARGTP